MKNPQSTSTNPHAGGSWLVAAILSIFGVLQPASAVILPVSGFTDDGSYDLTSVTIGGTTYTDLTGSTATIVNDPSTSITNTRAVWIEGTTPVVMLSTISAAASGLNYQAGAANIWAGTTFQFGRTVAASDRIFLWDFGVGDAISFQLIDGSGSVVGDYSLALAAGDFGTANLVNFTRVTALLGDGSTQANPGVTSERGVSFQLSDFSGSLGDLTTVTGLRVLTPTSGLDPSLFGLAAIPIPEPVAGMSCLVGVLALAAFRRRVARRG